MAKKSILAILFLAILMLSILIIPNAPVKAWEYQDDTPSDTKFEKFGPRADKLLIKLYSTAEAEWDALARGEIDITDWPLSKPYYDLFASNAINPATGLPYNETINVIPYGPEFDLFILDLNNNNNQYLGNPPNPAYPNPVYPNPTSVKEMRQAIAYLTDRGQLDTIIGLGFYSKLYTPVPPSMGAYSHPEIRPGGALEALSYPYSRINAAAKLAAGHFPIGADGWRYWDRNGNGVKDAGEDLNLKFFIRSDHNVRLSMGVFIANELEAVKVHVTRIYGTVSEASIQVMANKDFNIYTGGWGLGVDPDHLILWNWDFYWHPGRSNNYAGVNNADYNTYSYGVMYANDFTEAKTNAWLAQEAFAENALSIPLWSTVSYKAMSCLYTGGNKWTSIGDGEDPYRGQYWDGAVSVGGYGVDSDWSFLNMHPRGFEAGNGSMTIRWGFSTTTINSFNPIYVEWPWDQNILNLIYEPLLRRNPYNLTEFMPWLADAFEVSTYEHPVYGTSTKIKFTLRPDATWADGTPITTADVYFTFVKLDDILKARGLPPPSWKSNVMDILDFRILDPYDFEVLFDVKSVFALSWMAEQIILPMHIWKPLAETGNVEDIAADPNEIGSGPWRFGEYVANSYVLLYANEPGSTVQTSHPSSVPITSPLGYFHWLPFETEAKMIDPPELAHSHRIPLEIINHTFGWSFYNEFAILPMENVSFYVNFTIPGFPSFIFNETVTVPPATKKGELDTETEDQIIKGKMTKKIEYEWRLVKEHCHLKLKVFEITKTHVVEDIVHKITTYITQNGTRIAKCEPMELIIPKCQRGTLTKEIWVWTIPFWRCPPPEPEKRGPKAIFYFTINEDIIGSTLYDDMNFTSYPYKSELPSPDFKVDIRDVATAAKAFGSYSGHPRWCPVADINGDYKIDIKDIAMIAKKFGWVG